MPALSPPVNKLHSPIQYATTAYRPSSIPKQPAPEGRPKGITALDHNLSVRLPWGYTEQVIPNTFLEESEPKNLARIEKLIVNNQRLRGDFDEEFDHICIRPVSLSGGSRFWNIMYQLARMGLPMLSFFTILAIVITYYQVDDTLYDLTIEMMPLWIVTMGIPAALWFLSSLYFRIFPVKAGKGSAWEINRQTGMITVYKEEQDKRIAHTKPFYEFDAYLVNIATHQGNIRYQFALRHRYEDLGVNNLFSGGAFDNPEEGWAMWYFIQNYMDVSQPLPDEGTLEMFRHLDPTTREYDQQTGRNPRYWRDMTHQQWKQACREMGAKIANLQLGGKPDLMTNYVDYRNARSFATRE